MFVPASFDVSLNGSDETDAGYRVFPTVKWAISFLVRSPLFLAVALAAGGAEVLLGEGTLLRWLVSATSVLLVTALAAITVEDAVTESTRTRVDRLLAALSALPSLVKAIVTLAVVAFVGVLVPIVFIRLLGVFIAIVVFFYLIALFEVVFPAVVLDGSMSAGWDAFRRSKLVVFGLLVVFAAGRFPISYLSPTLADPVIAVALAGWSGLLTGISTLAYARVYIAQRPAPKRP